MELLPSCRLFAASRRQHFPSHISFLSVMRYCCRRLSDTRMLDLGCEEFDSEEAHDV